MPPLRIINFDCYAQPSVSPVPKSEHDPIEAICLTYWENGQKNFQQRMITVDPLRCLQTTKDNMTISDEQCDDDILELLEQYEAFCDNKDRQSLTQLNQTVRNTKLFPTPGSRRTYPARTSLGTRNEMFVMSEVDLLDEFALQVRYFDPDVILSWNLKNSMVYLIQRSIILGLPWYCSMLGRYFTPGITASNQKRIEKALENSSYGSIIKGRTVYNWWKVARDDLQLRSTSFGATCEHVLGESMPKFNRDEFAKLWSSNREYVVRRWLKVKGKRMGRIVDKLGSLSLGAEISTLCNISCIAAITRGSQIRQEGLFCEMARQFNFTLPTPSIDDRKNQSAVVSLPLNMEPYSEFYTSGVTVLDFKSLYPSVIIAHNLCYSTIVGNKDKFLTKEGQQLGTTTYQTNTKDTEFTKPEFHMAANGHSFVSKRVRRGFVPGRGKNLFCSIRFFIDFIPFLSNASISTRPSYRDKTTDERTRSFRTG